MRRSFYLKDVSALILNQAFLVVMDIYIYMYSGSHCIKRSFDLYISNKDECSFFLSFLLKNDKCYALSSFFFFLNIKMVFTSFVIFLILFMMLLMIVQGTRVRQYNERFR